MTQTAANPLGLNLDFLLGRGFLWAKDVRLTRWASVDSLRMEIPDLQFPFDFSAGLGRFRNTRCWLREVELSLSEHGIAALVEEHSAELGSLGHAELSFLEGAFHVAFPVRSANDTTSFVSFRVGVVTPQTRSQGAIVLSAFDYRGFGPLPEPARLLGYRAFGAITSILKSALYTPEQDKWRDTVRLQPLKILLARLFPPFGWKLPDVAAVTIESVAVESGKVVLKGAATGAGYTTTEIARDTSPPERTRAESARATAAHSAKSIFAVGDEATFAGDFDAAVAAYAGLRHQYGSQPALIARQLDLLLAQPSPGNLVEAEALCRELEDVDDASLIAASARPTLAQLRGDIEAAVEAYDRLAELLGRRNEVKDLILCRMAQAALLKRSNPRRAVANLRDVVRLAPRSAPPLELLRDCARACDDDAGVEDALKRLTGVYRSHSEIARSFVELARLAAERRGDFGEARVHVERALRADPENVSAQELLGDIYLSLGEPYQALKVLGEAANRAPARTATQLHVKISRLWFDEVGDIEQAMLALQHAMGTPEEELAGPELLARAEAHVCAAEILERAQRRDEAIGRWLDAVRAYERSAELEGVDRLDCRRGLAKCHRSLAVLYSARGRDETAIVHLAHLLEMDPTDVDALDSLERAIAPGAGREELLAIYRRVLNRLGRQPESFAIRTRLSTLLDDLGRPEDAIVELEEALSLAPGALGPRKALSRLLRAQGREAELVRKFVKLAKRAADPDTQAEILMEAGGLLEGAEDLEGAGRVYRDAAMCVPGSRQPYVALRRVFQALASERGYDGPSPIGGTIADDLVGLWRALADSTPDAETRSAVLRELEDIALMVGRRDEAVAANRARSALRPGSSTDSGLAGSISEVSDWSDPGEREEADFNQRDLTKSSWTPAEEHQGNNTRAPWSGEPTPGPSAAFETLEIDREEPVQLLDDSDAGAGRIGEEVSAPSLEAAADLPDEAIRSGQTTPFHGTPAIGGESDRETHDTPHSGVAAFRAQFERDVKKAQPLPKLEALRPGSTLSKILRREDPPVSEDPQVSEDPPVSEDLPVSGDDVLFDEDQPGPAAIDELADARRSEEPRRIAMAIAAVLGDESNEGLTEGGRRELEFELAELLYFDLEDSEAARPHLEWLREHDPEGYGARPGVLNALEAIYDETGDIGGRVALLEGRLARAETQEMRIVHSLALAQLEWDERGNAEAAASRLQAVLDDDSDHEAANRLLAEIAKSEERWEDASSHLERALKTAGDGVDVLEMHRELADLLLDRLDRPEAAAEHFQLVIDSAPGDARAAARLRDCFRASEQWERVLESLADELRLILGATLDTNGAPEDWLSQVRAKQVSEPLRATASQILCEAAAACQGGLKDPGRAAELAAIALDIWPENVDALDVRIQACRAGELHEELAGALTDYAVLLLDPAGRFDALVESARAWRLAGSKDAAVEALTNALAAAEEFDAPGEGLAAIHAELEELEQD